MSKTTILVTVLALVFIAAVAYALLHLGEVNKREVVNRYYDSEFSFTYPLGYELEESSNEKLSIGSTTQGGFSSVVELTRLPVPVETTNFDEYMRAHILEVCASEGAGVQTHCTAVASESKVKTATDENAQVYELTLVRESAGQEPETFAYGPLYVYLIGPSEDGATKSFEALIVHPSLTSVLTGSADQTLLSRINDSVRRGSERK